MADWNNRKGKDQSATVNHDCEMSPFESLKAFAYALMLL